MDQFWVITCIISHHSSLRSIYISIWLPGSLVIGHLKFTQTISVMKQFEIMINKVSDFQLLIFILLVKLPENKLVFLEVSMWCSDLNFHFTFVVDKCDNFNLVAKPITGTELWAMINSSIMLMSCDNTLLPQGIYYWLYQHSTCSLRWPDLSFVQGIIAFSISTCVKEHGCLYWKR